METKDVIKNLRKRKNLNQDELAQKINIKTRAISAIERGEKDPSAEETKKLSQLFNVSTDYILTGQENEKIEKTEMEFLKIMRVDQEIKKAVEKIINSKKKMIEEFTQTTLA